MLIKRKNQVNTSRLVFKRLSGLEVGTKNQSKINQKIVGCIMFSSSKDDVYKTVNWITEDEYNLYIHRLAVHPIFQKRGIARKMMDFAEDFAKSNNYISIRLDTFSQNPRNNKFYKSRGYNKLGDVYFPKQSEFPFHCYEKLVD